MKLRRLTALTLTAALLLTACGPKAAATTMRLVKTQGGVSVADGEGRAVEAREALGLYSGYAVGTQAESYAWIDLDEAKLTKLDQNSDISIRKEDKHLEIEVKAGSLFFNVTQPLAEDETLEIRSSTMLVGIRGTCGWVEVPDGEHMNLCLLEGTVECSAGEETVRVEAGERAELSVVDGQGTISVTGLQEDIPAFVQEELESGGEDPEDPENPEDPGEDPEEEWPIVTEEVMEDGSVYVIESYEDGTMIERVTGNGFTTIRERDALFRFVREEFTSDGDYHLYTYHYSENSPVVTVSVHWIMDGQSNFQGESVSYTMQDAGNGVRVTGTTAYGEAGALGRDVTIAEFRMDSMENIRTTTFVLNTEGAVIETRAEALTDGHYG